MKGVIIGFGISIKFHHRHGKHKIPGRDETTNSYLLESGGFLLMEDGGKILFSQEGNDLSYAEEIESL